MNREMIAGYIQLFATVAIFSTVLILCGDAELWQRFVAASLASLVWVEWLGAAK